MSGSPSVGSVPPFIPNYPPNSSNNNDPFTTDNSNNYVVNSKIMVVAVAVLFAVVLFILCLHIYAKWFWRNQAGSIVAAGGSRTLSWRRRRRYGSDAQAQGPIDPLVNLQSVGLDRSVVEALPTFEYKAAEMKPGLECAVCLEEFEESEKGRTLPKCGHNFHLECIDMWLHSHSTCPLCRASVRPDEEKGGQSEAVGVALVVDRAAEAEPAVIGDVQAPFMAAMRASRRMRGLGGSPAQTPTAVGSLPRTAEDQEGHGNGEGETPVSQTEQPQGQAQETHTTAAGEQKSSVKGSEIPSNILFWGNQTHVSAAGGQPASIESRSSSGLRAPFQVAIDIPRGQASMLGSGADAAAATSPFSNLMYPMARASASFRRLLSRGKGVAVSPQALEDTEEGGPSSQPPPPNV